MFTYCQTKKSKTFIYLPILYLNKDFNLNDISFDFYFFKILIILYLY